jgi:hypothetical protein
MARDSSRKLLGGAPVPDAWSAGAWAMWAADKERCERLWSQAKRLWVFSPRQTLWRGDDGSEDDGGMTAYAWFIRRRTWQASQTRKTPGILGGLERKEGGWKWTRRFLRG